MITKLVKAYGVDVLNYNGETPLHAYLKCGLHDDRERIVRLLLDQGADPHIKSISGDSALDYLSAEIKSLNNLRKIMTAR